jgi:hypothetical protein
MGSNREERSADSGQSEPVGGALAARRGAILKTPFRQSHHSRVEIQFHGEVCPDVRGSSAGPHDSWDLPQRTNDSMDSLDGPGVFQLLIEPTLAMINVFFRCSVTICDIPVHVLIRW